MKAKQPESILKQILKNTKPKTKQAELKQQIQKSQQKLSQLKNKQNPQLLQRITQIQKQIKRLEIITINDKKNQQLYRQLTKKDQQQNNRLIKSQVTNEEQLVMLKNVTTKNYTNKSSVNDQQTLKAEKTNTILVNKQFSPSTYITTLQQKTVPAVMQSQIYPILNRYLSAKSSLLQKIIQLNPQKRHNNSLLIPHQRVMLKQHLDVTRRIVDQLDKKAQQLQEQLDKDFVVVKSKWEQSQRELIKLAK